MGFGPKNVRSGDSRCRNSAREPERFSRFKVELTPGVYLEGWADCPGTETWVGVSVRVSSVSHPGFFLELCVLDRFGQHSKVK